MNHKHIFKPRMQVTQDGETHFWGECGCGEQDA